MTANAEEVTVTAAELREIQRMTRRALVEAIEAMIEQPERRAAFRSLVQAVVDATERLAQAEVLERAGVDWVPADAVRAPGPALLSLEGLRRRIAKIAGRR